MESIQHLMQYVLHIDTYLFAFVNAYGALTYIALFAIIFFETALVITPFLPGDSLLFAAGSIAAGSNSLNIQVLFLLLLIASILGNKVNYLIGRLIGPRVFTARSSWLLNQKHLQEAHQFYEKHGGKMIIFARFLPIIRSFAPFVAGIGYMSLRQFTVYNIISAVLWIGSMLGLGYYFGTLPFIKEHFSIVVYGIIAVSLIPPVLTLILRRAKTATT